MNLSLGLGRGDRTKLTAFIAENKATLLRDYRKLTFAEKQAYNACVLEDRQAKNRTARANPKAIKHDVNAAFTLMDREVCRAILIILSLLLPPLWHLLFTRLPSVASLVYSFVSALCSISRLLFCPLWHLSSTLLPSVASLVYSFALCGISRLLFCPLWHLSFTHLSPPSPPSLIYPFTI